MTASAKSIFGRLEYPAALKVPIFCLYVELHHGIDHMLKLICTGHLARLINLANNNCVAIILFTVISNHR